MTFEEQQRLIENQDEIFRLARKLSRPDKHVSKQDLRQLLLRVAAQAEAVAALCEENDRLRAALEEAREEPAHRREGEAVLTGV